MISFGAAAGMVVVALGMVLTPGPNMIYLVSRSLSQGVRAGLISLAGVATGFLFYVFAAVVGLTALFTAVPALYLTLKLAGAAYLLWLAIQALRGGKGAVFAEGKLSADSPRKLYTMGLVTNLLNPKVAIIYLSLLPQFIDPERGSVAAQALSLGLLQIAVAVVFNGLWVLMAGRLARFLAERPLWTRIQRWFMATVLGTIAVRMATDPR